jgi:hypothetical protein
MTEAEWLAATDPEPMLAFLHGKVSDRKLRLFACACCRSIWNLLREKNHQRAVEVAERYADGEVTPLQLEQAEHHANFRVGRVGRARHRRTQAAMAAWRVASGSPASAIQFAAEGSDTPEFEREAQCKLLRDIIGNPFRHATSCPVVPAWRLSTFHQLALTIYDGRNFDQAPFLADALEDAGFADADLLGHLRGPGPHVRGCWAVDLILSKDR